MIIIGTWLFQYAEPYHRLKLRHRRCTSMCVTTLQDGRIFGEFFSEYLLPASMNILQPGQNCYRLQCVAILLSVRVDNLFNVKIDFQVHADKLGT